MRFARSFTVGLAFGSTLFVASNGQAANSGPQRRAISPQDNPAKLLKNPSELIRNLKQIEDAKLLAGAVAEQPWSDDYWAIANGQLGYRYLDEDFRAGNFSDLLRLFEASPALPVFQAFTPGPSVENPLDRLSPAEKYDLIVGDENFSLTQSQWAPGKRYAQKSEVESWMGLCHGWAAAAYMLPRATKSIELKTKVDAKPIKFYPADIKALATLLWAQSAPRSRLIGDRCNEKEVRRDSRGRIKAENCFNTNPATFHSILATLTGAQKRSFVMDVTYNYEVWNQPVRDYKIVYFDLDSGKESERFEDVALEWKRYKRNDPFRRSRGSRFEVPQFVVGVRATVNYMVENTPTDREIDGPSDDSVTEVIYEYDLELDRNHDVIGGEWISDSHPDFLWTYDPGSRAQTMGEIWSSGSFSLAPYDGDTLPDAWAAFAKAAAKDESSPLGVIVEELIRRSNR